VKSFSDSHLWWVGARQDLTAPVYLAFTNLCVAIARKVCWQRIYFISNLLTQALKHCLDNCLTLVNSPQLRPWTPSAACSTMLHNNYNLNVLEPDIYFFLVDDSRTAVSLSSRPICPRHAPTHTRRHNLRCARKCAAHKCFVNWEVLCIWRHLHLYSNSNFTLLSMFVMNIMVESSGFCLDTCKCNGRWPECVIASAAIRKGGCV
jgi:hypothetical protein